MNGEEGGNRVSIENYLNGEEKRELIEIASQTIRGYVRDGAIPEFEVSGERLKKPGAAFVTIRKGTQLRGCIGYTEALYPLYKTVVECAVASASEDPRFPPLSGDEVDDVEIEISVLTPLKEVKELSEIEVGKHGLMVTKGSHRGLLLPQVATEYGWDLPTFLSHTCMKAGLPEDAWEKGASIFTFEAQIIQE